MNNRREKRVIVKQQISLDCKKCGKKMERRAHKEISEKQKNQPFYFSEWDYCNPRNDGCGMVQHYDKYRVLNPLGVRMQEQSEQEQHFFNI